MEIDTLEVLEVEGEVWMAWGEVCRPIISGLCLYDGQENEVCV